MEPPLPAPQPPPPPPHPPPPPPPPPYISGSGRTLRKITHFCSPPLPHIKPPTSTASRSLPTHLLTARSVPTLTFQLSMHPLTCQPPSISIFSAPLLPTGLPPATSSHFFTT